jgi:hypothetical protein
MNLEMAQKNKYTSVSKNAHPMVGNLFNNLNMIGTQNT